MRPSREAGQTPVIFQGWHIRVFLSTRTMNTKSILITIVVAFIAIW